MRAEQPKTVDETTDLAPFHDFLDEIDDYRDDVKINVKVDLSKAFAKVAPDLASLFFRAVKTGKTNKAKKHINLIAQPIARKNAEKYFNRTVKTGSKLAKYVTSKIKKATQEQGTKKIKLKNGAILAANVDTASEIYTLDQTQFLESLIRNGVTQANAKAEIESNIKNVGRETGKYFNAVSGAGQSYLFDVADDAMRFAFQQENLRGEWRWVTFFTRSCPDCIERHNMTGTYRFFEGIGLPRSGRTVCRVHCHCVLVPDSYPVKIKNPVKRERSRPKRVKPENPKPRWVTNQRDAEMIKDGKAKIKEISTVKLNPEIDHPGRLTEAKRRLENNEKMDMPRVYEKEDGFFIDDGRHRIQAAKDLGYKTIPVVIIEDKGK
jgi:hypothetical protein